MVIRTFVYYIDCIHLQVYMQHSVLCSFELEMYTAVLVCEGTYVQCKL